MGMIASQAPQITVLKCQFPVTDEDELGMWVTISETDDQLNVEQVKSKMVETICHRNTKILLNLTDNFRTFSSILHR